MSGVGESLPLDASSWAQIDAAPAMFGPVRATVIEYVNPAVAAILGVLVLNETLTVPMVIGFALVTIGSLLATRSRATAGVPEAVPAEA